jgi:hypothetical protein
MIINNIEFYPIKDHEDYLISKCGKVYSLPKKALGACAGSYVHNGVYLKEFLNETGYPMVALKVNKVTKIKRVHRLLAINFIPNPDNKPQINHKNGIRNDYNLENLEWATQKENNRHSYDILKRRGSHYNKKGKDHFSSRKVYVFEDEQLIKIYNSQRETAIGEKLCEATISVLINKNKIRNGRKYTYNND